MELQSAGVPPMPLNVTVLAFWVEPKLVPAIVIVAPTVADVVDKFEMVGRGKMVNGIGLLATPPTVTTTFPVIAPFGTGIAMLAAPQLVGVPTVPLNATVLVLCVEPKFTPEIVTGVPTGPDRVEMLNRVGAWETVNGTALLAAPPAMTTTLPEEAPLGTGTTILVALQFVGVPAVPLNVTVLVPCVEPKFEPAMVTEAVGTAVVGVKLTIEGERVGGLKLSVTLSKVAVASDDVLPLFTIKPT